MWLVLTLSKIWLQKFQSYLFSNFDNMPYPHFPLPTIAQARFCHLAWWSLIIIKWRSWSNFSSNTPCPRPHPAIHFWHSVHFLDWSKDYYLEESRSHAILTRFFFFVLIVSDPFLHESTGFFFLFFLNEPSKFQDLNFAGQFRYPMQALESKYSKLCIIDSIG